MDVQENAKTTKRTNGDKGHLFAPLKVATVARPIQIAKGATNAKALARQEAKGLANLLSTIMKAKSQELRLTRWLLEMHKAQWSTLTPVTC
eukprot:6203673-Pleurochrysis_carterae.AAC.2